LAVDSQFGRGKEKERGRDVVVLVAVGGEVGMEDG